MAFDAARLRALREVKGLSQDKLANTAGVSQSIIAKAEKGRSVRSDVLDKLAGALDCTMDYLYGRGGEYPDPSTAAAHMAFDVFAVRANVTDEQRERCRRALKHPDAPKTADAWHSLAEMMELGIGPASSASARLTVVKHRPGRSKAVAISRARQT